MSQLDLWGQLPLAKPLTIQQRFLAFHYRNPNVYRELRLLALKAIDAGRKRYGIATLYEVLRWGLLTTTGRDFKMNNDFKSRYARLLMEREPKLKGFFDVRDLRTE